VSRLLRIATEQWEIAHEPEEERAELRDIYRHKGLQGELPELGQLDRKAIAAFYQRLCTAGKPKKVALTAYMHKLLTILNAIVRQGTPWPTQTVP
jgi:hypothetical protein